MRHDFRYEHRQKTAVDWGKRSTKAQEEVKIETTQCKQQSLTHTNPDRFNASGNNTKTE